MFVRQLVNTIKVRIEAQSNNAQYQDRPLRHPRPPIVGVSRAVGTPRKHFGENPENPLAQFGLTVDVLQPTQKVGDVIRDLGFSTIAEISVTPNII